jgi:hypothetical protein
MRGTGADRLVVAVTPGLAACALSQQDAPDPFEATPHRERIDGAQSRRLAYVRGDRSDRASLPRLLVPGRVVKAPLIVVSGNRRGDRGVRGRVEGQGCVPDAQAYFGTRPGLAIGSET